MKTFHFEPGELMRHMQSVADEVAGWHPEVKRIFAVKEVERRTVPVDSKIEPGWTWVEWVRGWRYIPTEN